MNEDETRAIPVGPCRYHHKATLSDLWEVIAIRERLLAARRKANVIPSSKMGKSEGQEAPGLLSLAPWRLQAESCGSRFAAT